MISPCTIKLLRQLEQKHVLSKYDIALHLTCLAYACTQSVVLQDT